MCCKNDEMVVSHGRLLLAGLPVQSGVAEHSGTGLKPIDF